jgi:GT2 family glycosyltransferase
MADLSIIIVNWNTRDLLKQCLTSVFEHTHQLTYEIFVVDNASSDGSAEMVEQEFPAVRLIKNTENHGFSKANNQALAKASGRYLLLLNSDTKITDNAFLQMTQFMEMHPSVGMAGPQLLNPDESRQYSCDYFPRRPLMLLRDKILDCCWPQNRFSRQGKMREWDYATSFQVDYLIGAVLLIRRETFERIGPLDEQFFMYAEDIDWCYRSVRAGWENYYLGETHVVHYNRGSSEKTAAQAQRLIHLRTSSLLRFYKKHYGTLSAYLLKIITVFHKHATPTL